MGALSLSVTNANGTQERIIKLVHWVASHWGGNSASFPLSTAAPTARGRRANPSSNFFNTSLTTTQTQNEALSFELSGRVFF